MFGNNPIRSLKSGDGSSLDIQNIFKTLQGEGPFAGTPAIFIRLGGCNLACSFCDTEFEDYKEMQLGSIMQQVDELSLSIHGIRTVNLIVITGGEPMRQPIEKLCKQLIEHSYKVQIETNGTLMRLLDEDIHIVCSPKPNSQGIYSRLRHDLLKKVSAIKFIISKNNILYNKISEIGQTEYNVPVYLQPMDEYNDILNQENMKYTIDMAINTGHKFSLQTHKILNIE